MGIAIWEGGRLVGVVIWEGGRLMGVAVWNVVVSGGGGVPATRGSSVYLARTASPICCPAAISKPFSPSPLFLCCFCLFSGGEAFLKVAIVCPSRPILTYFRLMTTIRTQSTEMTTTSASTTATDIMMM